METLDLVEMADYAARYPHELSGGQQQRVALARALVLPPLSAAAGRAVLQPRRQTARAGPHLARSACRRDLGLTTLFVTHDQDEALSLSDRIVVMNRGSHPAGRLTGADLPAPDDPLRRRVPRPMQHPGREVISISAPTQLAVAAQRLPLTSADPASQPGDQVELAIRPEAIQLHELSPAGRAGNDLVGNEFVATIRTRSFLGDRYIYELDIDGLALVASATRGFDDAQVAIHIPRDACRILAAEAAPQPATEPATTTPGTSNASAAPGPHLAEPAVELRR